MSLDTIDPLRDAPPEVLAFLGSAARLRVPDLRIHPLTIAESRACSSSLQQTAVGAALGLVALDDADDSNPYCYVGRGVARGMVIFFSHDPEPELRYSTLAAFEAALVEAAEAGRSIDDLRWEPLAPLARQDELIHALTEFASADDEVAEFMLCTLAPLLAPTEVPALETLARHPSFLVREAAAVFLSRHPLPVVAALAAELANDPHGQVSRPARRALEALASGRTLGS